MRLGSLVPGWIYCTRDEWLKQFAKSISILHDTVYYYNVDSTEYLSNGLTEEQWQFITPSRSESTEKWDEIRVPFNGLI